MNMAPQCSVHTDLISPLVHAQQVLEGFSVILYWRERRERRRRRGRRERREMREKGEKGEEREEGEEGEEGEGTKGEEGEKGEERECCMHMRSRVQLSTCSRSINTSTA